MNTSNVEASIIGSLILYPELFQEAAKVLIPTRQSGVRVFREHNRIWDWMVKAQFEQMRGWDVQLVSSKFKDVPELIRQAEPETLSSSILYLREEYERAVLKKVCEDALQRLDEESPYSVASDMLSNLTDEEPEVKEKLRGDKIHDALNRLLKGEVGVDTIIPEFNEKTGGLGRGRILVIAGTPGTGKTEEALRVLIGLAKQGKACAFFSLELHEDDVYQRLFQIESGLSAETLSNRVKDEATGELKLVLNNRDAKKLSDAVETIGRIPLFVYDIALSGDSIPMIMQKIRWEQRNNNLFAYCVDYIQLCKSGVERIDNSSSDTKRFDRVCDELGKLTKRIKVSGIWIAKLNSRKIDGRGGDRRPRMEDLFGTSTLDYIADLIMLLYRPRAYESMKDFEKEDGTRYNEYDLEMIIGKNRVFGGKTGSWWRWQENESQLYSQPVFERIEMPRVDPDAELPF
jgi:replicative DNA helicase